MESSYGPRNVSSKLSKILCPTPQLCSVQLTLMSYHFSCRLSNKHFWRKDEHGMEGRTDGNPLSVVNSFVWYDLPSYNTCMTVTLFCSKSLVSFMFVLTKGIATYQLTSGTFNNFHFQVPHV